LLVESDGADRALFVTTVMDGGVLVVAAAEVGLPFRFADELFGLAEREAGILGEAFRAFGDQHHVRTLFENFSRQADGILQALETRCGASTKRGSVHDDGIAFDCAIAIEMGAVARIEHRIVLENNDRRFDGFERGTARSEDAPASRESVAATDGAGFDGVVGNVPSATVNNQRGFHGGENCKGGCGQLESRLPGVPFLLPTLRGQKLQLNK